jgi:hypothetical protein
MECSFTMQVQQLVDWLASGFTQVHEWGGNSGHNHEKEPPEEKRPDSLCDLQRVEWPNECNKKHPRILHFTEVVSVIPFNS